MPDTGKLIDEKGKILGGLAGMTRGVYYFQWFYWFFCFSVTICLIWTQSPEWSILPPTHGSGDLSRALRPQPWTELWSSYWRAESWDRAFCIFVTPGLGSWTISCVLMEWRKLAEWGMSPRTLPKEWPLISAGMSPVIWSFPPRIHTPVGLLVFRSPFQIVNWRFLPAASAHWSSLCLLEPVWQRCGLFRWQSVLSLVHLGLGWIDTPTCLSSSGMLSEIIHQCGSTPCSLAQMVCLFCSLCSGREGFTESF